MAKGEITFYFDTLAELRAQMLETLGMGAPAGADRPVAWPKEGFEYPAPEPTPEAVRGSLGNLDTDMPAQRMWPPTIAPTITPPMAGKTAIPLPELSEEGKAEIAAPPAEIPPAAAQAAPAPVAAATPSPAAPAVPPPPMCRAGPGHRWAR